MAQLLIVSSNIVRVWGEYSYAQNNETNKTTLYTSVKLQCYGGGGGSETFSGGVQIGGNFYNGALAINLANAGTYTLYSRSDVLEHNPDGTFPANFGIQFNVVNAGIINYSNHVFLNTIIPTIPRASSISNNSSENSRINFGSNVSFTISRASNNFTHDLTYAIGGNTYAIGTGIAESKTYSFSTNLINSFPSTSTPNITVTCTTKNSNGNVVGTSTTIVYLNVPNTYVPTCTLTLSKGDNVVPNNWGIYVKSKSKITGTISASGSAYSTISSVRSFANGQTFTTNPFTTSEITSIGDVSFTSTVTDSRGRTASDTKTISVVDYWNPSLSSYSVERCNSDGTLNPDGNYGKVICEYSIAPCSNKNAKSLVVTCGSQTKTFALNTYSGTIEATSEELFSGLANNSNYVFTFKIIDTFESSGISYNHIMPPSYCLISRLNGGKGISFGQVATEEGFHVHMLADLHEGLHINGTKVIWEE